MDDLLVKRLADVTTNLEAAIERAIDIGAADVRARCTEARKLVDAVLPAEPGRPARPAWKPIAIGDLVTEGLFTGAMSGRVVSIYTIDDEKRAVIETSDGVCIQALADFCIATPPPDMDAEAGDRQGG